MGKKCHIIKMGTTAYHVVVVYLFQNYLHKNKVTELKRIEYIKVKKDVVEKGLIVKK